MSRTPLVRVREVMHTHFDLVDGLMTVSDALRSMKHSETKTLIIDKRHDDDVYGMLLFADIAKRVLAPDLSPDRINMYESWPRTGPPNGSTSTRSWTSRCCASSRTWISATARACWTASACLPRRWSRMARWWAW